MPKADQPAAEERREGARTVKADQLEQKLAEHQAETVAEVKELPKSLQPASEADLSELFFKQSSDLEPGQRAVMDRTSYGAPVVHRY